MLDRQYNMYSVNTALFYSNHEKYLHDRYCDCRREQKDLKNKLPEAERKLKSLGYTDSDLKKLKTNKVEESHISAQTRLPDPLPEGINILTGSEDLITEYLHLTQLIRHKSQKAKDTKEKLLALLSNKASQNELTDGKDHIRAMRQDRLNDSHIISVFESALSRITGIGQDELTKDLMVVQIYYFDLFKDITFFGFTCNGEKYQYFTSSAGQIRKKKAVFIKEATWNRIKKTVMCGLTVEKINARGGINVNKYLAYLALAATATDEWSSFDIDRSIVIDDFKTDVYGTFDFVDETDYSITRKTDYVPIPHTDGAGMILPDLSTRNFMFRAPWIKGLLGVFDFRKFIEVNGCSPIVADIYGQKHNIIEEDIQIIFTKSQFKMWKYYDSWEEYKTCFKKYHCSAGTCNREEDRIKNAKINYQMLQTLTDITEEEIDLLTRKSSELLNSICTCKESIMALLGITPYNTNMTPFQKAVKLYPALLQDTYAKDVIRDVKDSLVKKYRSGKLEADGKHTFLLPDYYAACEYWFGHQDSPAGLLQDGEVYCRLFRYHEKVDCLRSPHLYREHAVRLNAANDRFGDRAKHMREWFLTDAVYTSTHDLISKLLQFDVDGDRALVIADRNFAAIAERNMEGIVPLYYNMRKADPVRLSDKTIYAGLTKAFTSTNIGLYSNDISKIWNHDVFLRGSAQEKQEALDVIKLLCMENNFAIDAAKTLYMPKRPEWFGPVVSIYTSCKLPAFFEYAKDKEGSQIENRNGSLVNKLYEKIPDRPLNTRGMKLEPLNPLIMKSDGRMICSREVSDLYDHLSTQYRYMIYRKDEYQDNLRYVACKLRAAFRETGYSDETIADMLVQYLYGNKKRYKQLLWFCYGQYLVNNIERNLKARGALQRNKYVQCIDCGEWLEVPLSSKSKRCEKCNLLRRREKTKARVQKYRNKNRNDTRKEAGTL